MRAHNDAIEKQPQRQSAHPHPSATLRGLPALDSQLSTAARPVALEGVMQEILFVVEEAEDGSFRASAAAAAIHTEAETLEELHREIRDAVLCHFDPGQAPPLIRLHHVKQELLAL